MKRGARAPLFVLDNCAEKVLVFHWVLNNYTTTQLQHNDEPIV